MSTLTSPTTAPPRDLAKPAALVTAAAAAVAAVLLAVAGWVAYDTATYAPAPHEDTSLAGLGYVVAVVMAAPAVLAALLAGLGIVLVRRGRHGWALGLGITSLVVTFPLASFAAAFVGLG